MKRSALQGFLALILIAFITGMLPVADLFHNHQIDGQAHHNCPVHQLWLGYQSLCLLFVAVIISLFLSVQRALFFQEQACRLYYLWFSPLRAPPC